MTEWEGEGWGQRRVFLQSACGRWLPLPLLRRAESCPLIGQIASVQPPDWLPVTQGTLVTTSP